MNRSLYITRKSSGPSVAHRGSSFSYLLYYTLLIYLSRQFPGISMSAPAFVIINRRFVCFCSRNFSSWLIACFSGTAHRLKSKIILSACVAALLYSFTIVRSPFPFGLLTSHSMPSITKSPLWKSGTLLGRINFISLPISEKKCAVFNSCFSGGVLNSEISIIALSIRAILTHYNFNGKIGNVSSKNSYYNTPPYICPCGSRSNKL